MSTLSATQPATSASPTGIIDPRGQQFTAAITVVVLALVLLLAPGGVGIFLLTIQTALFGLAVALGVQRTPHALLYRAFVRPRLGPPAELEDPAPPRFAQAVGFTFAVVGLAAYLSGLTLLGQVAIGFALAAALLNAVFGFCLGCEMYLLLRRVTVGRAASAASVVETP